MTENQLRQGTSFGTSSEDPYDHNDKIETDCSDSRSTTFPYTVEQELIKNFERYHLHENFSDDDRMHVIEKNRAG